MSDILLPKGWVLAPITQLISTDGLISDGDWVESKDQDINGSVRLIQLADVGDGYFQNKSDRFMSIEKAKALNCTFLKQGDLLIARMPAPLGRACVFPEIGQKSVTVVDICIIRTSNNSAITNSLLTYWLNSPFMRNEIEVNSSGTTRKRITRKKLEQFVIPLPPSAEQKIIAEKLDLLLAQVKETKSRLERIPEILKQFRQSVLSNAVSGKLTEDWRINKTHIDVEDISLNWNTLKLTDIGDLSRGRSKHRPRNDPKLFGNEYPFIQTGDVANSNGRIKKAYKYYSKFGLAQSKLFEKGTLCITIAANIADTAILDIKACFPDSIVGFLPKKDKCNALFVKFLIDCKKNYLNELAPATAQKNINLKILNEIYLSIPSLEEQCEIVRRVEQLFAYADKIEQQVNAALEKVNHLTQSILAKAFRGELTAQWRAENVDLVTGENSAASLLEKIQAEREQNNKSKKKNNK